MSVWAWHVHLSLAHVTYSKSIQLNIGIAAPESFGDRRNTITSTRMGGSISMPRTFFPLALPSLGIPNQAVAYLSGELRDTLSQMPRMSSQFSDVRFSFVAAADNMKTSRNKCLVNIALMISSLSNLPTDSSNGLGLENMVEHARVKKNQKREERERKKRKKDEKGCVLSRPKHFSIHIWKPNAAFPLPPRIPHLIPGH